MEKYNHANVFQKRRNKNPKNNLLESSLKLTMIIIATKLNERITPRCTTGVHVWRNLDGRSSYNKAD